MPIGYRRRVVVYPVRRAKLPPGYRREKKNAARGLYPALDGIVTTLKRGITTVAKDFGRSEAWVRSQVFGGSKDARFLRRAPTTRLRDAYVHFKAKELNQDLPSGEKWQLADIQEKIRRERVNYKNRPVEEQQQWIKDYEQWKEENRREKRVNRKAEQLDATSALKRISSDLDTLHTRTGVRSVLIAARADILFIMNPYIFSTQAADDFFVLALGKTLDQVARAYEMYNIHGASGLVTVPKNAGELKHELRQILQTKLTALCGTGSPHRRHISYDHAIVFSHGVRLVGWTFNNGRIVNPGSLTMPDKRALYDGLIKKTVYWQVLGPDDDVPVAEPKKRKVRSDKDEPRGSNKRTKQSATADASSTRKQKKKKPPLSGSEGDGTEEEEEAVESD